MSTIDILGTIVTGDELTKKIAEVAAKATPDPPSDLKDKFRWLQCTLKNETQFPILLGKDTYFDSGRYWTPPSSIGAFDQLVFSCCNSDNSTGTGVSGGTPFSVNLDDQHHYDLSFGWTNPAFGSYKGSVVESSKGEDGYNAASSSGGSLTSKDLYEGQDKDGRVAQFRIQVSAAPSQYPIFVITELAVPTVDNAVQWCYMIVTPKPEESNGVNAGGTLTGPSRWFVKFGDGDPTDGENGRYSTNNPSFTVKVNKTGRNAKKFEKEVFSGRGFQKAGQSLEWYVVWEQPVVPNPLQQALPTLQTDWERLNLTVPADVANYITAVNTAIPQACNRP